MTRRLAILFPGLLSTAPPLHLFANDSYRGRLRAEAKAAQALAAGAGQAPR